MRSEERLRTNDVYRKECDRLICQDLNYLKYVRTAKTVCISDEVFEGFEEHLWSRKNTIEKTLGDHNVEGKTVHIPRWKRELERHQWYRDTWARWTVREEIHLEFGYQPIIKNWQALKLAALKFINE